MVGQSGCELSINMKKNGEGTNATKNSGYFPVCNADVMMKIVARPGCTRTKGCSLAREKNKNKKLDLHSGGSLSFQVCIFKLGQYSDFNRYEEK